MATNTVVTVGGVLKEVTLEEFLAEVNMEVCKDYLVQYNQSYGQEPSEDVNTGMHEGDTLYIRRAVALGENSKAQVLEHLLEQVNFFTPEGEYYADRLEKTVVASLEHYGAPTHVVELTHNVRGVFCLEDFKYKMRSPLMGAIICYASNRNLIFKTTSY